MPDLHNSNLKPVTMSRRELLRVAVLLVLGVLCASSIWYLRPRAASHPPVAVNTLHIPEVANKTITLQPFATNGDILKNESDDEYLKTEGFYYLVHQMMTASADEIAKTVNTALVWRSLVKSEGRAKLRGQTMRVKGGLVNLKPLVLEGKEAKARGLEGATVWEVAIYNAESQFYLGIVTELPANLHLDDDVELCGAFFKIWKYESQNGRQAHAPVIIGKGLKILVRTLPKGPQYFHWIIAAVFLTLASFMMWGLWRDRQPRQRRPKTKTNQAT